MPGDDPAGRAGVDLDLGRQGFAGHDDPARAHRPAGSDRGGVVARIGCQVLTQAFATTTDMLNAA